MKRKRTRRERLIQGKCISDNIGDSKGKSEISFLAEVGNQLTDNLSLHSTESSTNEVGVFSHEQPQESNYKTFIFDSGASHHLVTSTVE